MTFEAKIIKVANIERTIHGKMISSEKEISKLIRDTLKIDARGRNRGNKRERYVLIIECLAITGLRISELIHFKLKNCKKQKELYIQVMGKGNNPKRIFIPEKLDIIKIEFSSKEFLFTLVQDNKYNKEMLYQDIRDLVI